jgi:uncharacterized membrane protein YoaK (UPF0700 family)
MPATERTPAIALAAVGGCVDAIGFLVLTGLFIAHQSGNSTGFGVAVGQSDWMQVLRRGFVIPVFVVATAVGVIALEPAGAEGKDRRRRVLLLVEAALLLAFGASAAVARADDLLDPSEWVYYLVGTIVASAMGLQNALLRKVGSQTVHTTFITGMLTDLAVGLAHLVLVRRRGSRDPGTRAQALLSASVFGAYIGGAAVGSLGDRVVGLWMVAAPIGLVIAIAVLDALADRPPTPSP